MIKFRVKSSNSGSLIGFGLSEENVVRLKAGQPILVDGNELGFKNMEIVIMYGETEAAIMEELRGAGLAFNGDEE